MKVITPPLIPGQRFGRWTVIAEHPKRSRNGQKYYLCRCDCGTEKPVRADGLRAGKSTSCSTGRSPLFFRRLAECRRGPDECWNWPGPKGKNGYAPYLWIKGKKAYAYRMAYIHLVGPVPEGLELDHLCRNPACINPAHLEPVTHLENCLRSKRIKVRLPS